MSVNQRIIKETQKLKKDPVKGIVVHPVENNPRYFNVVIDGPSGSPYEGGHFKLQLHRIFNFIFSLLDFYISFSRYFLA